MSSVQMTRTFSYGRIFLGVLAGLIGGVIALVVAFIGGVIGIGLHLRDLPATLLASATVLPLMFLFILLLPTLIMGVVIGFVLGLGSNFTNWAFSVATGGILGLVCAEVLLAGVVPLLFKPEPGDFVSIASNPFYVALFGFILGAATSRVFRWIGSG